MKQLAEYIRIREHNPKRVNGFVDALGSNESHRLGRVIKMLNDLIDACGPCTALALVEAKKDLDDRLIDLRKAKEE
jgi:hypothetical protein